MNQLNTHPKRTKLMQLTLLFAAASQLGQALAITYAEQIAAMPPSPEKTGGQWSIDQARKYQTQADGVERSTDVDAKGKIRLWWTPQAMTAADCSPGRHWEIIQGNQAYSGIAGCVCDNDMAVPKQRVGNDQPSACSFGLPTLAVNRTPVVAPVGASFSLGWTATNATNLSYNCSGPAPASAASVTLTSTTSGVYSVAGTTSCTWTASGHGGSVSVADDFTVSSVPAPTPTPAPAPVVAAPTPAPAPVSATVTGYFCAGYTMTASYSDGTQGVIDYNSATCGYGASAPAPAPVAAPTPTPDSVGGSFCSGTTLVGWMTPSGAQFVQEANSASCGYSAPAPAAAPAPAPAPAPVTTTTPYRPIDTFGGYFCSGSALVGWMTPSGSQFVAEYNSASCAPPPYVVWTMYSCNFDQTNYAWSDGTYTSSGSGQNTCQGSDTSQ